MALDTASAVRPPRPRPAIAARVKAALSPREWARAGGLAAAILGLHVLGWLTLVLVVAPRHYLVAGGGTFGVGLGITAYTLGMRHAFDADHIAAIDNTTRKFLAEGKRPLSVGFFFSLGHSSVVFLGALLISVGIKTFAGQVQNGGSTLHGVTGVVGASVSGGFLYLIGLINLVILWQVVRVFRRMRHGDFDEAALEDHLNNRGLMNRFLGRLTRAVREPWQMYPLGFLFGLGFDTVTEIGLLVLAAGAATSGLPWYAILCLPVLFAAGMSLLDTIDGSFMNFAYGWAFSRPVRKVYYNITITGLSVAVALIIGTVELVGVLARELGLTGGVWDAVANLDLNLVGYFIVALFVLTWLVSLAVWRFARIEQRWNAGLSDPGASRRLSTPRPRYRRRMHDGTRIEPVTDGPPRLAPGAPAPDFSLSDADGGQITLSQYRGRKVIVYFYPAASTPGCTTQAGDFRDSLRELAAAGVDVVGISPDPPEKLQSFRGAEQLNFPLLSDPERATMYAYGAYGEKQNYGKTHQGVIRSTFVVDERGDIAAAYYNVKATGHVARLRHDLGV